MSEKGVINVTQFSDTMDFKAIHNLELMITARVNGVWNVFIKNTPTHQHPRPSLPRPWIATSSVNNPRRSRPLCFSQNPQRASPDYRAPLQDLAPQSPPYLEAAILHARADTSPSGVSSISLWLNHRWLPAPWRSQLKRPHRVATNVTLTPLCGIVLFFSPSLFPLCSCSTRFFPRIWICCRFINRVTSERGCPLTLTAFSVPISSQPTTLNRNGRTSPP